MTGNKFNHTVKYLVYPDCKIDPNLKHQITEETQFSLQDMPELGFKSVLACPTKQKTAIS